MTDVVPESFIKRLRRALPKFRTLSNKDQPHLALLIWETGSYRREHRSDSELSSFSYQELEKRFGRSRFDEINATCKVFDVTPNWSHVRGETRGFKLSAAAAEIKKDFLNNGRAQITSLIREDGKRVRRLPEALEAKDLEGVSRTAWRGAKPLNKCPVDIRQLRQLHSLLGKLTGADQLDLFTSGADREAIEYDREVLAQILRMAKTDVAEEGYVMLRYAEARTGRLYARGINLQTVPRLVRHAALHGLYDYDIANCHFAIFYQMAACYGFNVNNIKAYLEDKAGTRAGIAERTEISIDAAKLCLIATMYGARTSNWFKSAIPVAIGSEAATRLYKDPVFCGIHDDIQVGRKAIINGHPRRPRTIVNAVGKAIQLKRPDEEILAHLIQGVEVQALKAALDLHRDHICLLMHDGFVALRKLSIPPIEAAMKTTTGYELRLVEEKIQLPPDFEFSNS
jgi:hypothetical protein